MTRAEVALLEDVGGGERFHRARARAGEPRRGTVGLRAARLPARRRRRSRRRPLRDAGPPARPPAGNAEAPIPDALLVHYNADGGRSDFCGNGSRCAARFAVMREFATWPVLLQTDCGALRAEPIGERVRIEVPHPSVPAAAGSSWTARPTRGGSSPPACRTSSCGWRTWSRSTSRVWALRCGPTRTSVRRARTWISSLRRRRRRAAVRRGACAPLSGAWRRRPWRAVPAPSPRRPSSRRRACAHPSRCGRPPEIASQVDFEEGASGARRVHLTGEAHVVYEGVLVAGGGAA